MKKTITKLLAILLVIGLCGCSNPQKDHYKAGIAAMETGDYAVAIEEFTGAEDYKDAQSKLKEAYYCLGSEHLENDRYDEALDAFTLASDYEDAPTKVDEVWYRKGMAAYNEQLYSDAIACFTKSHDFNDTRAKIKECWYLMGAMAFEAKEYDDAVEYFGYAEDYEDAAERIREVWYTKGKELLTNQKYDEARIALTNSNGYNDANLRLQLCDLRETLSEASVGDYIKFGTYEQDNKTNNGKEEIEWKVVAKSENKLLVVSRYVLTSKSYDADAGKTWANTKIRTWLNGSFYDGAFTDVEKMS
ncbi:MAG: hypothetical protein HUJ58_08465, partial [Erysipelotrichaceae bacterium]|nr:hypothetical protein [Erysipelotrichaceae bacterium]